MINPFKAKKGLGRGLSSLIGDSEVKENRTLISISSIIRNKFQPRKIFEKEDEVSRKKSEKQKSNQTKLKVKKSKEIAINEEAMAK